VKEVRVQLRKVNWGWGLQAGSTGMVWPSPRLCYDGAISSE